jgi:hypothetical protein
MDDSQNLRNLGAFMLKRLEEVILREGGTTKY